MGQQNHTQCESKCLQWLLYFDKAWCGPTQLSAFWIEQITAVSSNARKLAFTRLLLASVLLFELAGYFLITLGLAIKAGFFLFVVGIALKIGGGIAGALFQNIAGSIWSIELHRILASLKPYSQEINASLSDRGCSETEVQALYLLPSEIYQSEISSYRKACLLNLGAPLSAGAALLITGDFFSSLLIIGLGVASFPIGEQFFKKFTFRSESKMRLGRSAAMVEFLKQVYREHFVQTVQVNFISQVPLLLFAIRFLLNGGSALLASFFGYTQGLIGLSGTLAFQRSRVSSLKSTETATHLFHALSNKDLLFTPSNFKHHVSQSVVGPPPSEKIEDGVALHHFMAVTSSRRKFQALSPINCLIPAGEVALLQAQSGKGKTTLLMALKHLLNHEGELFFISESKWTNVHVLSQERLQEQIFYYNEENTDKGARLVDLFKDVLLKVLEPLYRSMHQQFDPLFTDLAWNIADNLLEQEILALRGGKESTFPKSMLGALIEMQYARYSFIRNILHEQRGNLQAPHLIPERIFSTLSSGEKRRFVVLLALELAKVKLARREQACIKLMILDEPLAHLDQENMEIQIETIAKMQQLQPLHLAPSIFIISHHFTDELAQGLRGVQCVRLN